MPRVTLPLLDREVAARCASITDARPDWPCRAGCDDCCRSLSRLPDITEPEWHRLRDAIEKLAPSVRERVDLMLARGRREPNARPIVCPLLDRERGLCLVYEARPIECRTFGFYAERAGTIGCAKIHAIAEADDAIVWGNHERIHDELTSLGERRSLLAWIDDP